MTGPTVAINTRYIMTLHSPLDAPYHVARDISVYAAADGGWVKGPEIEGEIISPSGDWLRRMPDGTAKLDVRLSIKTTDGSFILVTYLGRSLWSKEAVERWEARETLGPDLLNIVISPTFETAAERYQWLNRIVAVGKAISYREGPDGHITYDIFAME